MINDFKLPFILNDITTDEVESLFSRIRCGFGNNQLITSENFRNRLKNILLVEFMNIKNHYLSSDLEYFNLNLNTNKNEIIESIPINFYYKINELEKEVCAYISGFIVYSSLKNLKNEKIIKILKFKVEDIKKLNSSKIVITEDMIDFVVKVASGILSSLNLNFLQKYGENSYNVISKSILNNNFIKEYFLILFGFKNGDVLDENFEKFRKEFLKKICRVFYYDYIKKNGIIPQKYNKTFRNSL